MTIDIDVREAMRRPSELVALVEAIVAADAEDEATWVEWKSRLTLGLAGDNFEVAKAVLSFANRLPDAAAQVCGGLAYVIVGAEAGGAVGVEPLDSAVIDDHLTKYLGTDGPGWSPTYVTVEGVKVLVVVVEPPQWGDRMHTLRKTFGGALAGTVYVRRQAKSVSADHAEIRALEDRRERGLGPGRLDGLEVSGASREPDDGVLVVDRTPDGMPEWLAVRREALVAHQQKLVDAGKSQADNPYAKSRANSARVDEAAIDANLRVCEERIFDAQCRWLITNHCGMFTMAVKSSRSDTLEDVELRLTLDSSWTAFEEDDTDVDDLKDLPPAPPLAGLGAALSSSWRTSSFVSQLIPPFRPSPLRYDPGIDIAADAITLRLGQLRPGRTVHSSSFHLFLHDVPVSTTSVPVRWELHSPSTDGVQVGELHLQVHPSRQVCADPAQISGKS